MKNIKRFFKNRSGASAVEYGLLVALIAVTLTGGMGLLGTSISSAFAKPADAVSSAASGAGAPADAGDDPGGLAPVVSPAPAPVKNPVARPMGEVRI